MATAEGTARLLRRAVESRALHPGNVRALGPQLSCAAMGFGAYRVGGGDQEAAHGGALRAALRTGVNLIDTSSHYSAAAGGARLADAHGASERLIGRVVAEALEAGEAAREELILCTKVGHVAADAGQPSGAVQIAPEGVGGAAGEVWHSIDPAFVEAEVRASRQRLGTAPDFVLLHNPEYFLSAQLQRRIPIAEAWEEMYERLERSFGALEALCEEGVIASGYGVSSNFLSCLFSTTGRSNVYEALALDRVLDAAARAAGGPSAKHRLSLVQLPLNAVESGAVLGRGAVVPEADKGDCDLAGRLGVALVTNRPLNALPLPGVSTGDWGRNGPSHWRLRDAKPMGVVESLIKRVLQEAIAEEGQDGSASPPLQQVALRLALSAPSVACCLCGSRTEGYVEDVAAVLRAAPLPPERVQRALTSVRAAAEELGCERRGLW
mmetsp:Transcript_13402/g.27973  ORF Transcript_13402/g.27973 Transcript_13402/m.27973 type:complete len:438 (+) Transcript_13402:67-1380(+)